MCFPCVFHMFSMCFPGVFHIFSIFSICFPYVFHNYHMLPQRITHIPAISPETRVALPRPRLAAASAPSKRRCWSRAWDSSGRAKPETLADWDINGVLSDIDIWYIDTEREDIGIYIYISIGNIPTMIWYDIEYYIYIYIYIYLFIYGILIYQLWFYRIWENIDIWLLQIKKLGYAIWYGICHGNIVQGGVDRDVETDVNVGYYWCINVDMVQLGHENGDQYILIGYSMWQIFIHI